MNFFKDGLSIDETRISVLVLAFLATLAFAFFQLWKVGDISDNLLTLLGYEIIAVTGVNVADKIVRKKSPKIEYEDSNINTLP